MRGVVFVCCQFSVCLSVSLYLCISLSASLCISLSLTPIPSLSYHVPFLAADGVRSRQTRPALPLPRRRLQRHFPHGLPARGAVAGAAAPPVRSRQNLHLQLQHGHLRKPVQTHRRPVRRHVGAHGHVLRSARSPRLHRRRACVPGHAAAEACPKRPHERRKRRRQN